MDKPQRAGLFITLEGGEGSGKSTQAHALAERLRAASFPVTVTREPGGTSLGEVVRELLKRPALARRVYIALAETSTWSKIDPRAELFLFEAARAQLVSQVVRPALDRGETVICDRFTDSTLAYQGYGRGLDLDIIHTVNDFAAQGLRPDLTVLLDLPVEVGLARKLGEQENWRASLGGEETAFHERVRRGFLTLAQTDPERWFVVDATQSPERITEIIWARLKPLLERRPQRA